MYCTKLLKLDYTCRLRASMFVPDIYFASRKRTMPSFDEATKSTGCHARSDFNRRNITNILCGSLLSALFGGRSAEAQGRRAGSTVRRNQAPGGEVLDASYQQDGVEVRMLVKKTSLRDQYVIELVFDEGGARVLRTSAVVSRGNGGFGRVTLSADGSKFHYEITVDIADVPTNGRPPSGGVAKVTVVNGKEKQTGTFDLRTWQPDSDLKQIATLTLPPDVDGTIAPFRETLTFMVNRSSKETLRPQALTAKPSASFWERRGCSMSCWGAAGIGSAIGCICSSGTLCVVFGGALSAAAAYCDKNCPG